MPGRTVTVALLVCLALLPARGLAGDFKDDYRKGREALDYRRWQDAVLHLRAALRQKDREGDPVRLYGVRIEPYLPHFYLGFALFETGDYPGALQEWAISEEQKTIQRAPQYQILQEFRAEAEKRTRITEEGKPPMQPSALSEEALHGALQHYQDAVDLLALKGCFPDAIGLLRDLVALSLPRATRTASGDPVTANLKLSEAYLRCGDLANAEQFLQLARLRDAAPPTAFSALEVKLAEARRRPASTEGPKGLDFGSSYALVIGASHYEQGWQSLPGVVDDVAAVGEALRKQGFQVQILMNPHARDLEDAFAELFYGKPEGSRILLYFAGHGYTLHEMGETQGYIVPVDAPNPEIDKSGFKRKAIYMSRFQEYVHATTARHVLLVFDSCFSGALFNSLRSLPDPGYAYEKIRQPSRAFITAGEENQAVSDHSYFRRAFVDALEGGDADQDGDGVILLYELGPYIARRVVAMMGGTQNPQTPQWGYSADFRKGDFPFRVLAGNRPER
jgi:caspase domain-containing protein